LLKPVEPPDLRHFAPSLFSSENTPSRINHMMILEMVLLVVLPYGTALICGALTYWAGAIVSGFCSVGGLALGIYFFHKCMELLSAS
jgi:hypothetical protein